MIQKEQREEALENLVGLSTRAVGAVFAAYGLFLQEPRRGSAATPSIIALMREAGIEPPAAGAAVAFSGPKIRGELLLAATFDVISRTRPSVCRSSLSTQSAANQLMGRDWTGELANQALGHLKNQLRVLGLAFESRTPMLLTGQAVALKSPKLATTRPVLLRAGSGGVCFWLDASCDSEVDWSLAAAEASGDGKLVLF